MASSSRRFSSLIVLAVAASLSAPPHAAAASITWTFEGVVRVVEVYPPLGGTDVAPLLTRLSSLGAVVGSPISGFVRFETVTPDIDPGLDHGNFAGAVQELTLYFESWSLPLTMGPARQSFDVGSYPKIPGSNEYFHVDLTDSTATFALAAVQLVLSSQDPAVFSPNSIPLDPPSLDRIDPFGSDNTTLFGKGSEIFLGASGPLGLGSIALHAQLTSLVRVPEPNVLTELALVGAALAVRRRLIREYLREQ